VLHFETFLLPIFSGVWQLVCIWQPVFFHCGSGMWRVPDLPRHSRSLVPSDRVVLPFLFAIAQIVFGIEQIPGAVPISIV
jgi:hypothetical protein